MNSRFLIHNAIIINEGKVFPGYLTVENGLIADIGEGPCNSVSFFTENSYSIIDADQAYLIPGGIDDQVHFREPGLTHKADIYTESRAAVAGGITSFMDMPNTVPQTITNVLLMDKHKIAAETSLANFSFFPGATNNNIKELLAADPSIIPGVKVFLGASTGNMLVDKDEALEAIFRDVPHLIAIHSEYEPIIQANLAHYKTLYGEDIPVSLHPMIRSTEACFHSTQKAVALAKKFGSRLHVLHVSTADELGLFEDAALSAQKRITAEACVHHLWFDNSSYDRLGSLIKWNPAIKTSGDREALLRGVAGNLIDIVATDHAPHTLEEKSKVYTQCPSGAPAIQHSLLLMFELSLQGHFPLETVVQKMCHNVALCFGIEKRGYIRKGYHADLVLVHPAKEWTIEKKDLHYKCGWSPWEGQTLHSKVTHTFVNGNLVYCEGVFDETIKGKALKYKANK